MSTATRTSRKSAGRAAGAPERPPASRAGLGRGLRLQRVRIGDRVQLLGQGARAEPAALASLLVEEGVAQRAQEIAEVVLVPEQARPGEHAGVGLLDEVLRVFA